jgi:hypothetical protein
MLVRLVISSVAIAVSAYAWMATPADAADLGGQNSSAAAQASGGQLTVQAGNTYWTPPPSGSAQLTGDSSSGGSDSGSQPSNCTYTVGDASVTALLGPGGPEPGEWVFPTCPDASYIDPLQPIWVTGATPGGALPAVNPAALAQQAEKQLGLGAPGIEMAPPSGSPQLVGVPTWMWIDPGSWRTLSASASAGPVTATATATPARVVWDLGNGRSVTCDGPGTPYVASEPDAKTDCSYTWAEPGNYMVSATVYWSVTWTAIGAPGGGNLGDVAGALADVAVTVTESQAINTSAGGGN